MSAKNQPVERSLRSAFHLLSLFVQDTVMSLILAFAVYV